MKIDINLTVNIIKSLAEKTWIEETFMSDVKEGIIVPENVETRDV